MPDTEHTRPDNNLYITNFCRNIARLRREHGYSITRMAKLLHSTPKTLRAIERGELPKRVSVILMVRIHKVFGLSPNEQVSWLKDEQRLM